MLVPQPARVNTCQQVQTEEDFGDKVEIIEPGSDFSFNAAPLVIELMRQEAARTKHDPDDLAFLLDVTAEIAQKKLLMMPGPCVLTFASFPAELMITLRNDTNGQRSIIPRNILKLKMKTLAKPITVTKEEGATVFRHGGAEEEKEKHVRFLEEEEEDDAENEDGEAEPAARCGSVYSFDQYTFANRRLRRLMAKKKYRDLPQQHAYSHGGVSAEDNKMLGEMMEGRTLENAQDLADFAADLLASGAPTAARAVA